MQAATNLYDAAAMRVLDQYAQEVGAVSGAQLMQRAGAAAWAEIQRRWPQAKRIAVVCGAGSNGGDGYVIATLAQWAGLEVRLFGVEPSVRPVGDAAYCLAQAVEAGLSLHPLPADISDFEIIVDAIFGIGLNRPPSGAYADAIATINALQAPCLAVDVPSGLNVTSGYAPGVVVQAAVTVTFIAMKQGLLTGDGPAVCGEVVCADLDLPRQTQDGVAATAHSLNYDALRERLGPRRRTAHKGDFGHVLIVGGAPGYAGAARMAAESAARCGAGLVSLATHPEHAATVTLMRPEIMSHGVAGGATLRPLCRRASVIVLGPGLGQDAWARELRAVVAECVVPQIWDADALNLLAADPGPQAQRIVTPHPGEAARLLGCSTAVIQADRFAAAGELVERYGGVVVLKGAGTVVSRSGAPPVVIRGGNPGMASGGMGDVLSGVIAALLAQHFAVGDAAAMGACIHAYAADCAAAAGGERGLLAGDLGPYLRRAVNPSP